MGRPGPQFSTSKLPSLKKCYQARKLGRLERKQEFQEEPTPAQQLKVAEGIGPRGGDDYVGNSILKNPASKPKPIKNEGCMDQVLQNTTKCNSHL